MPSGFGQLAAALLSPVPAVGDGVIDAFPKVSTEFAKTQFGAYDKSVLLGGVPVVAAPVFSLLEPRHQHRARSHRADQRRRPGEFTARR